MATSIIIYLLLTLSAYSVNHEQCLKLNPKSKIESQLLYIAFIIDSYASGYKAHPFMCVFYNV